nr:MAG TPA: hypothetical protein [Caudoviricetes sp.]
MKAIQNVLSDLQSSSSSSNVLSDLKSERRQKQGITNPLRPRLLLRLSDLQSESYSYQDLKSSRKG